MAVLDGMPAAWSVGATYPITVRVEGGPPAMPAPQAQGGFDIAADAGLFSIAAADAGKLHVLGEGQEVTYRPEGTHQREWHMSWTAPTLAARPADVHVWLAVLAANGNHVLATNTSDQGETLDAAAHLTLTIPPAPAALEAWKALPLRAPDARVEMAGAAVHVTGTLEDANATRLAWRLDGAAGESREMGPAWTLRFVGLPAGVHRLEFRTEGSDRHSGDQTLAFRVDGASVQEVPAGQASPSPAAPLLLVSLLALAFLRRHP
jgi:hypothetical protein